MTNERRSKVRYPLELTVRYQSLDRQRLSGEGRTVNVSSSGLLMVAPNHVDEGARMKVTIEWPSLLNGTTPLQLVTVGKVVRRRDSFLAVALEHYQFRTMSRKRSCDLAGGKAAIEPTLVERPLDPPPPPSFYTPERRLSARNLRRMSKAGSEPHHVREMVIPG
jgi:PilZ domain